MKPACPYITTINLTPKTKGQNHYFNQRYQNADRWREARRFWLKWQTKGRLKVKFISSISPT